MSNWVLRESELSFLSDLMLHNFREVGDIWNGWSPSLRLPSNYLVFDLETTGFDPNQDLIVEVGWAIVQDRQIVDYAGMLLDWTSFDPDNKDFHDWLKWRLTRCAADLAKQG